MLIEHNAATDNQEVGAFITGGTGFLGSHFLTNFLGRRLGNSYALVRGKTLEERAAKLQSALVVAGDSYNLARDPEEVTRHLNLVDGCISESSFGIDPAVIDQMKRANLDEFWHFAATLNFEDSRKDFILDLNVDGAIRALDFARELGVRRFIYISTAYSCGKQEGSIPATLHDPDRTFSNQYERSKCLAEHALTEACAGYGIALTILRPAVVIGNSQSGLPAGSDSGLYGMLRELGRLRRIMNKESGGVRLFCLPAGDVNFIPVDELMDDIGIIAASGGLEGGGIFHLAYNSNPTNYDLIRMVGFELELDGLQPSGATRDGLSPLEELLLRRTDFYDSYLNSQKTFIRPGLPERSMGLEDLRKFVVEGNNSLERQRSLKKLKPISIRASDGVALHGYMIGTESRSTVLLCNALGMPMECMRPLMEHLARDHRVISWECRGFSNNSENIESQDVSLDRQALDGKEILQHFHASQAALVGWCTGSRLVLRMVANMPELATSVVLLHGGLLDDSTHTDFGRAMAQVMPMVAGSRRYATMFYESIFRRRKIKGGDGESERLSNLTSDALMSTDSPEFLQLASRPFRSADNLFSYARMIAAFMQEYPSDSECDIDKPILIVTGSGDNTASPESSRGLAKKMGNAGFVELPGRDHFALYHDNELMKIVQEFLVKSLAPA